MKIAGIQVRRRIFVSAGLVVVSTGIWIYWSRSHQPPLGEGVGLPPPAFVRIAGIGEGTRDKVMDEQAEYFDPTPLFLPTSKNFQQGELPARVVKQPGQVFPDFPPNLTFAESDLPDYASAEESGGAGLVEVMARGNVAPFAGLGMIDRTGEPLPGRVGCIEVKSMKDGSLSLFESLHDSAFPLADFAPVEYVLAVASSGLIGDPVLVASSGNDEVVDVRLKDYLVKVYRIGERLAPGRYKVSIGP